MSPEDNLFYTGIFAKPDNGPLGFEVHLVQHAVVEITRFIVAVIHAEYAIATLGQFGTGRGSEFVACGVHCENCNLSLRPWVHGLVEYRGLAVAQVYKCGSNTWRHRRVGGRTVRVPASASRSRLRNSHRVLCRFRVL